MAVIKGNETNRILLNVYRKLEEIKQDGIEATLSGSDIQIGAVEIKNGTDDTRATVNSSNELLVKETTLDQLVKTEDLAHSSGDKGVMFLGVRNDNLDDLTNTNGDYSPIATTLAGEVLTADTTSQASLAVIDDWDLSDACRTVGITFSLAVTQVTNASGYEAGDAVGGKITITNAIRTPGGTGVLQSIDIIDKANQKAAMELIIFNADPSAATITDDAAFVYSTDITKQIARIPIGATDYVTINNIATVSLGGLGRVVKAASGTNLYAALITTGTPTYTSTSDIIITFGILQD